MWDKFDSFEPYEAACLYIGYSPQGELANYPKHIKDVRKELIQIVQRRQWASDSPSQSPTLEVWVEDMQLYADMCDGRSKFLSYREKSSTSLDIKAFYDIKSELKEIKFKYENLESENRRLNSQIEGEYMNPGHPLFSSELESSVSVWMALFAKGEDVKNRGKASKTLIRKWLKENRPDLTATAIERIEILSNPQAYKTGGAPRSDI